MLLEPYNKMQNREIEQIYEIRSNKDCRLKLVYMNQEYRVIVYQYGTVNHSIKEILTVYHILVLLRTGTKFTLSLHKLRTLLMELR